MDAEKVPRLATCERGQVLESQKLHRWGPKFNQLDFFGTNDKSKNIPWNPWQVPLNISDFDLMIHNRLTQKMTRHFWVIGLAKKKAKTDAKSSERPYPGYHSLGHRILRQRLWPLGQTLVAPLRHVWPPPQGSKLLMSCSSVIKKKKNIETQPETPGWTFFFGIFVRNSRWKKTPLKIKGPDNPTCEVLCRPAWYAFGKRSVGKRWVVWDEWCELVVWDEGCEMSGVRWVVWDELWEMSCVS